MIGLLAFAGCTHGPTKAHYHTSDVKNLETVVSSLQEEIAILKRVVARQSVNPSPSLQESQRREAAAERARVSYSSSQRLRDLRALIDILERQRDALKAESSAYSEGLIIDYF